MSELAAPLKIYSQVLENIRVTDKKAVQNDPAVQKRCLRLLRYWVIPDIFWFVSPARSWLCVLWRKHLTMMPARSMLMKWST